MNRSRLLFSAAAVSVLALVSACGGDSDEGTTGGSGISVPSSSSSAASSSAASTPTASSSAPGSSDAVGGSGAADVEFADQSGAGDVVRVARVGLPAAGFVVITADDDGDGDGDDDDRFVGATPLPAGTSTDVPVTLDPPLTADSDLEAILYADTDGDGAFDAAVDQRVRETEEDDDEDDDVSEDADYDVAE